jgi:hypothetical protein
MKWIYKPIGLLPLRCAGATSLLLAFSILFLGFSLCAASYTLSIGHLPPLQNGHTLLLITDLSGSDSDVRISLYDDAGREVSILHKSLLRNGKIKIDVESYLQSAGTIVVESSNQQIVGEYWQMDESGAMFMLPLQSPGEEKRYFVNCFRFPSCGSNLLVLSDPYGSGPLVQMEFYSMAGELIGIARKLLRPHGTLAFEVNEYAPWDILGKVSVRSFRGSIVLHYRQICENGAVLAVPARLPARNFFARDFVIDDFSTGRGVTGNLVITDVSAEGPEARIKFLSDTGAVLSMKKLLPRNGTVLIDPADYIGRVVNGIIQISSESQIIADYWERNPQTVLHTSAVDKTGGFLFISHFSPFPEYAGINTQDLLSLLNVGQKLVQVRVEFYSDNGEKLGTKELSLEPCKQIDELVGHYFDEVPLGTMIVKEKQGRSASLVATSHIFDFKNSRHLGKAHAQVIRSRE